MVGNVDRSALFVDASYVLADGAMAVHGTRRGESVSWDYEGLLELLSGLARERTGLPLLRCYWYEATIDGRRTAEQDALADLPGIKLRVAKIRPGRREGVETEIHRDLTTLRATTRSATRWWSARKRTWLRSSPMSRISACASPWCT